MELDVHKERSNFAIKQTGAPLSYSLFLKGGARLKAEGDQIQLGKSEGECKECRGHPNLFSGVNALGEMLFSGQKRE